MTRRALAQEGPISIAGISRYPPVASRRSPRRACSIMNDALQHLCLGRLPHWPVLPRPQLAGFQVSTEG